MIVIPDCLQCLGARIDTRFFNSDSLELILMSFNDTSDPLSDGCEHDKEQARRKTLVGKKCAKQGQKHHLNYEPKDTVYSWTRSCTLFLAGDGLI